MHLGGNGGESAPEFVDRLDRYISLEAAIYACMPAPTVSSRAAGSIALLVAAWLGPKSVARCIGPGLRVHPGQRFGVDLTGVPCVGDSLRDLQAAAAVGAQPILVLSGKGEKTLRDGGFPEHTVIFPDLAFAATALLSGE